jgi:hypothetical protein
MTKYSNSSKNAFLERIPDTDIENSGIERRCKFNFSYFDSTQPAGQSFAEWSEENHSDHTLLLELMDKLKHFTKEPLKYWASQRIGAGGLKVFECYKQFPSRSDFIHPKYIPHDVHWARFRLASRVRLIGFVLPEESCATNTGADYHLDTNTFYVVFLDKDHRFYRTELD